MMSAGFLNRTASKDPSQHVPKVIHKKLCSIEKFASPAISNRLCTPFARFTMLLAVYNPETAAEEVAMLLDESPSPLFLAGSMSGEPWRKDGPLALATASAVEKGYAWLYIVYKKDNVRTWGSKRVKVTSGGELYAPLRTSVGNMTTELRQLSYSDLHPDIFRLSHCKKSSPLPFRAVTEAELSFDEQPLPVVNDEDDGEDENIHPVLGFKEVRMNKDCGKGVPLHANLGCFIDYLQKVRGGVVKPAMGYLLRDVKGFEDWRFELVEYQRRPFVKHILTLLGFVDPDDTPHGLMPHVLRQMQFRGLLQNVSQSMQALTKLIALPDPPSAQPSAPITKLVAEKQAEGLNVRASRAASPKNDTASQPAANGSDEYESKMEIEIEDDETDNGGGIEEETLESGSGETEVQGDNDGEKR